MNREEFWMLADSITGTETQKPRTFKRGRWNNRTPGAGRYENIGIIRYFSSENIHIATRNHGTHIFKSPEHALEFLQEINKQS